MQTEILENPWQFYFKVLEYPKSNIKDFDEEGFDLDGQDKEAIAEAPEVFDIGDGRYLIVES